MTLPYQMRVPASTPRWRTWTILEKTNFDIHWWQRSLALVLACAAGLTLFALMLWWICIAISSPHSVCHRHHYIVVYLTSCNSSSTTKQQRLSLELCSLHSFTIYNSSVLSSIIPVLTTNISVQCIPSMSPLPLQASGKMFDLFSLRSRDDDANIRKSRLIWTQPRSLC